MSAVDDVIPTGYHRHPNGGGLVADTASVPDSVFVSYDAKIGYCAKIGNDATIGDRAKIGDGATIGNRAKIGNDATIGYCATIGDRAKIGDDATIGNRAKIGNDAKIGNRATIGNDAFVENNVEISPGLEIAPHAYVTDNTGRNRAPVIPDIDRTILGAINESGHSLDMRTWHHACGATHCRGGWAIALAGEAGKKLEQAMDSEGAARAIYAASSPGWPLPNFYDSNAGALADMQMRAEASA